MAQKVCGGGAFTSAAPQRPRLRGLSFPPPEGTQGHILLAGNEGGRSTHPLIILSIGFVCVHADVCVQARR